MNVIIHDILQFFINSPLSRSADNGKDLSSEELVKLIDSLFANGIKPYYIFGTVNDG